MRIGILTMHRVVNYGSFLQAFALKQLVKEIVQDDGCEIEFIDIRKGVPLYKNSIIKKFGIYCSYIISGKFLEKVRQREFSKGLCKQFERDFYPMLGKISSPDSQEYDIAIIGSDEVFHCCQNTTWGFTKQLYGDIPNANKIFSYAASFGATKLDELYKFSLEEEISNSLNELSSISVRDKNSKRIVETLTNRQALMHFDPVLIYGYKKEIENLSDFKSDEDFIIVYSYNGRINSNMEISAIKEFAKKHKVKIYTIFCCYSWADRTVIPETPASVLKIFQKAKYIITDTFHGTIFSIITHKKFCVFSRNTNIEKLTSLLEPLNLANRIVNSPANISCMEMVAIQDIDYEEIETILENERIRTREFLLKELRGREEK